MIAAAPQGTQPPAESAKLLQILRDPILWGPDYPAALNAVPSFAQAGETRMEILPRQVIGHRAYTDRGEAGRDAEVAARGARTVRPMRVPVLPGDAQPQALPDVTVVQFPDDRSVRVGTPDREVRFLNPDVRIDELQQRWGKAERVTIEVLDDGTERRPIELTMYHFAGGAVVVVTTDIPTDPRQVDRVYLDTNAVTRAVF